MASGGKYSNREANNFEDDDSTYDIDIEDDSAHRLIVQETDAAIDHIINPPHIVNYVVPSVDAPTLADALRKIEDDQVYRGMVTVVLKKDVTHTFDSTQHLRHPITFIGDHDDLCGSIFWSRPRQGPMKKQGAQSNNLVVAGVGPFDFIIGSDNTITVNGVDEQGMRDKHLDPDFSSVKSKREIFFFTHTGKLIRSQVICSPKSTNTLMVHGEVPIPRQTSALYQKSDTGDYAQYNPDHGGYGFFFPPRVQINGDLPGMELNSERDITFKGVGLDMPTKFAINCSNLSMKQCWLMSDIAVTSHFSSMDSNINTSKLIVNAGSSGRIVRQFCITERSAIEINSSKIALDCSYIACSKKGLKGQSGSTISLGSTHFVGNNQGLVLSGGSVASMPDTQFYSNHIAVKALHRSTVIQDGEWPLKIIGSKLPIMLVESHAVLKKYEENNNFVYALIGGKVIVDAAHLDHHQIYVDGSKFIIDDKHGVHKIDYATLPGSGEEYEIDFIDLGANLQTDRDLGKGIHPFQALQKLQMSKKKNGVFIE